MYLTNECDYAFRVVRELADMKKKTVKAICEHEHVPRPFAYKILKKLERDGFVASSRGSTGGYRLIKPPGDITLFDIANSIDRELFLIECLREGFGCPNNSGDIFCGVHREFVRIQQSLVELLSEKTIKDLI
jgi:Rrf2 family protein